VLILGAVIMIGLIAYVVMMYPGAAGPGRSPPSPEVTQVTPVSTQPQGQPVAPGGTGTADSQPLPPAMTEKIPSLSITSPENPPVAQGISTQTVVTSFPATPVYGDSSGTTAPAPFTLSVSPASASGKPGDTISYTLRIDGGEGQTDPIHFTLKASALFFTQTYDLGEEQPPFPKTSVYQFTIPANVPSGITINGVLTANGAGLTREQPVTLNVL